MRVELKKKHVDALNMRASIINTKEAELDIIKHERELYVYKIVDDLGLDAKAEWLVDMREGVLIKKEKPDEISEAGGDIPINKDEVVEES